MNTTQANRELSKQATRVQGRLSDEKRTEHAEVARQIEQELGGRIKRPSVTRVALAKLKVARLREGLSLADIAARTGIERGNLSRLENSVENVEVNTLVKIADALGYDVVVDFKKRDSRLAT